MGPADRFYRSLYRRFKMAEGRSGQVILLDDRKLEIPIQPKLYAGELLDIVSSHFNLKEKEYFGLAYKDDTGHHHWLHLDRRVLEHDFTFGNNKKSTSSPLPPIVLHFLVKFYVETVVQLRDNATIELFYLQAKHQVFKGVTEVDSDTAFQLAAFVLQATNGDFIDDNLAKIQLKKLSVLPTSVLKDHPSLTFCHDEIINRYRNLSGLSRGQAIVNYMTIVQSLPTYGVHYFEVKDKGGIPWWLGLNHKGVSQFDHSDKKNPRRVFQWKQLENIYFRDKKFSIEVHDQKRVVHALSSFNLYEDAIEEPIDAVDDLSDAISDPTTQVSVSRRTFGPGNVTVYVWFAQTPALTKCIWSMAISQHQFYLDTKHSQSRLVNSKRSISQIALELTRSCQSLSPASSLSSLSLSSSTQSLCFAKIEEEEQSLEAKTAKMEMLAALKSRKEALEEALQKKNEELKLLCMKEAELIGSLPPETPVNPGENTPQIRKRIGTAFTISNNLIDKLKANDEEVLAKLELEFEIQSKITSAALKLANDSSAKKSIRKARKNSYQMSYSKLKDIEKKLQDMKRAINVVKTMKSARQQSDDEPSEDNCSHSSEGDSNNLEETRVQMSNISIPVSSIRVKKHGNQLNRPDSLLQRCPSPNHSIASSTSSSVNNVALSLSAPSSPSKPRRPTPSPEISDAPSPLPPRHYSVGGGTGYRPSSVYQTKTAYRSRHYPTLSSRSQSAVSQYDNVEIGYTSPYKHKFDSVLDQNIDQSGQYSVKTQRASRAFDSRSDIDKLDEDHQTYKKNRYQNVVIGNSYDQSNIGRSTSCHNNLGDIVDDSLSIESRSLDNLDCEESRIYDEPDGSKSLIKDNRSVYVAGNVNTNYKPLTINTKGIGQDHWTVVNKSNDVSPAMLSPKHLPRLRLPMYNEIQQEANYSPNVLKSPRELNFVRSETYSPVSEPITPVTNENSDKFNRSPKEWYESNLDSPLPVRKAGPQVSSPVSDLLTTVQQIGESSPPSPHKVEARAVYSPPLLSPRSPTDSEKQIISVGHFKPYHEEIKPYETSDFYKYSRKHRNRSSSSMEKCSEVNQTSASQVLLQVADDVWTNSSTEDNQFQNRSLQTPNTLPVDHIYSNQQSVSHLPSTDHLHVYEPIDVNSSNSSQMGKLSPQSRSQYCPPKPMTCEVLNFSPALTRPNVSRTSSLQNSPASPHLANRSQSFNQSANSSLNMDRTSLADAFHSEMLAWYEGQDNGSSKKATLV